MEPKRSLPCLQVPNHHLALRLQREYSYTATIPREFHGLLYGNLYLLQRCAAAYTEGE